MRCRGYFSIDWFLDGHSLGFLDGYSRDFDPGCFCASEYMRRWIDWRLRNSFWFASLRNQFRLAFWSTIGFVCHIANNASSLCILQACRSRVLSAWLRFTSFAPYKWTTHVKNYHDFSLFLMISIISFSTGESFGPRPRAQSSSPSRSLEASSFQMMRIWIRINDLRYALDFSSNFTIASRSSIVANALRHDGAGFKNLCCGRFART